MCADSAGTSYSAIVNAIAIGRCSRCASSSLGSRQKAVPRWPCYGAQRGQRQLQSREEACKALDAHQRQHRDQRRQQHARTHAHRAVRGALRADS